MECGGKAKRDAAFLHAPSKGNFLRCVWQSGVALRFAAALHI
jgi:hypothetical protein